jgi:Endonuclease-reverse transcriptase
MCGDWNTRIANLSPNLGEESTTRRSEDTQTNQRAQWLLDICEQQGWKILNGLQPGLPACNTFRRGDDSSCIDLIMTNQPSNNITYDPTTLNGLSDHVLVMTNVATPYLTRRQTAAAA